MVNCSITVDAAAISFSAEVYCHVRLTPSSVPNLTFDYATLAASHAFQSGQTSFTLAVGFTLSPRGGPKPKPPDPATLAGERWDDQYDHVPPDSTAIDASISYNSGTWTLHGDIIGLNLGVLYSLFDHADLMVNFLEHITIKGLSVTYQYVKSTKPGDKTSAGKSLLIEGSILIGLLELDLTYQHNGGSDWQFTAGAGAAGTVSSLGAVLGSICPLDISGYLPACIANITVPVTDAVSLEIIKLGADGSQEPSKLVCAFTVALPGGFHVSLVQFQTTKAGGGDEKAGTAKKLLRLSSGKLPSTISVPVIGSIGPPVDEIDFVWVSDDSADGGITNDELDELNKSAVFSTSPLGPLNNPTPNKNRLAPIALLVDGPGECRR
jgi:hypothetical protein